MREKHQKQMPLLEPGSDHPQARELEVISNIIDNTPSICGYVIQDLNKGWKYEIRGILMSDYGSLEDADLLLGSKITTNGDRPT
jgi:hypothetical protein